MKPPETQLPDGDPQLKAALIRVFGSEVAPAALRKRLVDQVGSEPATSSGASKSASAGARFSGSTLVKLAAAILLLGFAGWRLASFAADAQLIPPGIFSHGPGSSSFSGSSPGCGCASPSK